MARNFDQYVLSMLPDRPTPLKIRWFALRIRKMATYYFNSLRAFDSRVEIPRRVENPFDINKGRIPESAGLYWLSGDKVQLYVGATDNLRERFDVQFQTEKFDFWGIPRDKLTIRFQAIAAPGGEISKHQSRWIYEWPSTRNYKCAEIRNLAMSA
jgi:hypothetical protein